MVLVAIGAADIDADSPRVRVAALVHDAIDVGAALGRAGNKPGPEAPSGEAASKPAAEAYGTVRNSVCGRAVEQFQAMACVKRSP